MLLMSEGVEAGFSPYRCRWCARGTLEKTQHWASTISTCPCLPFISCAETRCQEGSPRISNAAARGVGWGWRSASRKQGGTLVRRRTRTRLVALVEELEPGWWPWSIVVHTKPSKLKCSLVVVRGIHNNITRSASLPAHAERLEMPSSMCSGALVVGRRPPWERNH